jgi:hypothetical protein
MTTQLAGNSEQTRRNDMRYITVPALICVLFTLLMFNGFVDFVKQQARKIRKKFVFVGVASVVCLSGCGGIDLTNDHLTLSTKLADVQESCYDSLKPDYTGIPKDIVALLEMSRQSNRTLLTAIGREPCKQMNFYEATVKVAESQNQAVTSGLESAGNLGMAFLGADVMKTALQEAGDSYKASEWARIDADKDSGNIFYDDSGNVQYKDSGNMFTQSPIGSTSTEQVTPAATP